MALDVREGIFFYIYNIIICHEYTMLFNKLCTNVMYFFTACANHWLCNIIQMIHGCKWNIQICCPEVNMSSQGRSPSDDISTEGQHIWMCHEQPWFICFVIWPTKSKYKIRMNNTFTFMFYQKTKIEIPMCNCVVWLLHHHHISTNG